jgi:hypothetical protein
MVAPGIEPGTSKEEMIIFFKQEISYFQEVETVLSLAPV